MVALTSRINHEFINTDEFLAKKNLKRLNIDPRNIVNGWAIDFCAMHYGNNHRAGRKNGRLYDEKRFQITVSSEVMASLLFQTT